MEKYKTDTREQKFSWIPGVFPGQGSADLWFANFTKHPAYYGVVAALKNGTEGCEEKGKEGCKEKEGWKGLGWKA